MAKQIANEIQRLMIESYHPKGSVHVEHILRKTNFI
jgi:hypothetical protein